MVENILELKDFVKHFQTPGGTVRAVDGISFSIKYGECFGVVGESGSGKSTTGYNVIGIYAPTSGKILFKGKEIPGDIGKRAKSIKKEIQMVFQDPGGSLNPKKNVREIITLPLEIHNIVSREEYEKKVLELIEMVGLPKDYSERHPLTLGGGERQLVAVARALATDPTFIVLDEPTSALDVSMQATVIRTLMRLQKDLGLTYIFITHNLVLMRNVASRVAIMYLGKIAELAPTSEFFSNPLHPYTKMLLSSIPVITDEEEALKPEKIMSTGEIPSPINPPPGCSFHPRCPFKLDICSKEDPVMVKAGPDHDVRCWLFAEKS
jgi:peptide/nickel transport system ATP-binding protein